MTTVSSNRFWPVEIINPYGLIILLHTEECKVCLEYSRFHLDMRLRDDQNEISGWQVISVCRSRMWY